MNGIFGEGAAWTLGVAGATRYPLDQEGAATATNTASILRGAMAVQILGYTVTAIGGGVNVEIVNHAGTALTGMTFAVTAVGRYPIGPDGQGVRYMNLGGTGGANVGIKCGAGCTAILHWRKL